LVQSAWLAALIIWSGFWISLDVIGRYDLAPNWQLPQAEELFFVSLMPWILAIVVKNIVGE